MSEHIHIIKTKREHLNDIDFNNATLLTYITDKEVSLSEYTARLDSLSKRFNNIITSGKRLTEDRLPVINELGDVEIVVVDGFE